MGTQIKCALFGTVNLSSTAQTIDISSLNLSSADDYIVLLDGSQGGYVVTKSAASFSVKREGSTTSAGSYQVITFV